MPMDHVERAEELFLSGCNCAQAVFLAFQDLAGLDEGTMLRLSAPFGGGCAGQREMCGAVSGMMLVMGQLCASEDFSDTAAKAALYNRLRDMAGTFERENGSRVCRELLGLQKNAQPDPSERTPEYYKTRPCIRLVASAARIIDEELNSEQG